MNIILLAPPAAGKGTQAELLKDKYNLNHISTGELFRNIVNSDSDLGKQIKDIMESGYLVSDDIVIEVVKNYLDTSDNKNYLLDGFPRNTYQAEKLDEILNIDYVILFNIDKSILADRISGRRLCKSCGAIYNVNIDPLKPKNDSICDKCGSELYQRKDDIDSFENRYNVYLEETKPIIEYYKNKNILYEINADRSVEEIFTSIEDILGR